MPSLGQEDPSSRSIFFSLTAKDSLAISSDANIYLWLNRFHPFPASIPTLYMQSLFKKLGKNMYCLVQEMVYEYFVPSAFFIFWLALFLYPHWVWCYPSFSLKLQQLVVYLLITSPAWYLHGSGKLLFFCVGGFFFGFVLYVLLLHWALWMETLTEYFITTSYLSVTTFLLKMTATCYSD